MYSYIFIVLLVLPTYLYSSSPSRFLTGFEEFSTAPDSTTSHPQPSDHRSLPPFSLEEEGDGSGHIPDDRSFHFSPVDEDGGDDAGRARGGGAMHSSAPLRLPTPREDDDVSEIEKDAPLTSEKVTVDPATLARNLDQILSKSDLLSQTEVRQARQLLHEHKEKRFTLSKEDKLTLDRLINHAVRGHKPKKLAPKLRHFPTGITDGRDLFLMKVQPILNLKATDRTLEQNNDVRWIEYHVKNHRPELYPEYLNAKAEFYDAKKHTSAGSKRDRSPSPTGSLADLLHPKKAARRRDRR